nr:ankyrin repeat domain-containing protein [uncultured Dyadobacter sp.]
MNTTDIVPLIVDPDQNYYEQQASKLLEACRSVRSDNVKFIQKYHPEPWKLTQLNHTDTNFGIDDARAITARELGFEDWSMLLRHISDLHNADSQVARFERAVDAVVGGDLETITALLKSYPGIVHERSSRGHKGTLLHYIAANGVENYRQLTPPNAVEIADALLLAGAEPDAFAEVYERKWGTTLELLVSSSHPARAGLQSQLAEKLLDYGAAVNGMQDNGSPLLTAIYFHYPEVAGVLVRRGARVDNVVTAAAMGHQEQLAGYLGEGGKLLPDAPLVNIAWLKIQPTPDAHLALAFVWAAMLDRVETVRFLLGKAVSPSSRDLGDWTALHWAGYFGYPDMVDLLLAHKAPLEARNEFGGTVLDQTLWATAHEGIRPQHLLVVRKLVDAGAKIHNWWLLSGLHPPLHESVAKILLEKVM